VGSDLSAHVEGNSFGLDTGIGKLHLYFEAGGRAVWGRGGVIISEGIWHQSVDGAAQPTMCVTFKNEEYCSYLFEWVEEYPETRLFLRAENEEGSSFNFWTAEIIAGKSNEIELALKNEGPRELMRKNGVVPQDFDKLVSIYAAYSSVAACSESGIVFEDADVKALELAAKEVEALISDEEYRVRAWEQGSDAGETTRTLIHTAPSRALETCQGLRFFAAAAMDAHKPVSDKPF